MRRRSQGLRDRGAFPCCCLCSGPQVSELLTPGVSVALCTDCDRLSYVMSAHVGGPWRAALVAWMERYAPAVNATPTQAWIHY